MRTGDRPSPHPSGVENKADADVRAGSQDMATFGLVDPMVVLDNAAHILSLNPPAQRLFGVRPAGAIGKRLETVWPRQLGDLSLAVLAGSESSTIGLQAGDRESPRWAHVYPVVGPDNVSAGRAIIISGCDGKPVGGDTLVDSRHPLPAATAGPSRLNALPGSGPDVASVLMHAAWQLGQTTDVTSVYICAWDPSIEMAMVLAEYIGPQASPSERVSDLGTCYVDSHRRFISALRADRHWVEQSDDPSTPVEDRRHIELYGAKSVLYVPFVVRGQLVGWAEMWESRHRRSFSRRTVALAQNMARVAAVAIDKAQLYERVQDELAEKQRIQEALSELNEELEHRVMRRTAELDQVNSELVREIAERRQAEADLLQRNRVLLSLQSATSSTAGSLDLDYLLETITAEMAHLLAFESCIVYHRQEESQTLTALGRAMSGCEDHGEILDLTRSPLHRRVLEEMSVVYLRARQGDLDRIEARYLGETGAKTLLLIPMVCHGRTVGLIELVDRAVERILCDYEISAAQLLTSQAAAAIENARLFGHAQREITERIRAENRLRVSLAEKEVLLKEIHHRVKNNLQVISSMLSLQAGSLDDPAALKAFAESQDRIRSMALIHEKLYRSQDLAGIDLGSYLEDLASDLVRSYQRDEGPVELTIDADGVRLGVDRAVPCGLIVNELVSNALKHAFGPDCTGRIGATGDRISIELQMEGTERVTLIVGDNGVGLPGPVNLERADSLGLRIVHTLVGQLGGRIEVNGATGSEFRISFPVHSH